MKRSIVRVTIGWVFFAGLSIIPVFDIHFYMIVILELYTRAGIVRKDNN